MNELNLGGIFQAAKSQGVDINKPRNAVMTNPGNPSRAQSMRAEREINQAATWAVANANLPRNSVKQHWHDMSRRRLFWLLVVEVCELGGALLHLWKLRRKYDRIPLFELQARLGMGELIIAAREAVKHEIGDCIAFLAFLGDRV